MAVDTASLRARRTEQAPAWRVTALWLAAGITASAVANALVAFHRATPRYFPDEYLYNQLARSVAQGDGLRVLGEHVSLPALLEPAVVSLAWLPGDPETAFRLTQAIHAVLMSLAVVPVYLLARRVALRRSLAVAACAAAVLSPDLLYVGYTTADALGYLLALSTVAAGVAAVVDPRGRRQLAFLALAGLAVLTRLQYAVLLPAFVVGSLAVTAWSPIQSIRRHRIVYSGLALLAIAGLGLGTGMVGRYGALGDLELSGDTIHWAWASAFLLALAAGGALVPGAVSWLVFAVRQRSTTSRTAFAGVTLTIVALLIAASAILSVRTSSERFFERYLMVCIPLIALAFACWVEDARPGRRLTLPLAALLLLAAARVPVSEYAVGQGTADSPFLMSVRELQLGLGVDGASVVVALVTSGAACVAAYSALGRRLAAAVPLAFALATLTAVSAGAHASDLRLSHEVAGRTLGTPSDWVDRAGVGNVTLLQTAGSPTPAAMTQAFWNRSVTRGALLGDATAMDGATRSVGIDSRGKLRLDGRPLREPLLVATGSTRPFLAGARIADRAPGFELVLPQGDARLSMLAEGLRSDGWLVPHTSVHVWPASRSRCLTIVLTGARSLGPVRLTLTSRTAKRSLVLTPRQAVRIAVLLPSGRSWEGLLDASSWTTAADGALVSARAQIALADSTQARGGRCR
jgi:hypothetical protein